MAKCAIKGFMHRLNDQGQVEVGVSIAVSDHPSIKEVDFIFPSFSLGDALNTLPDGVVTPFGAEPKADMRAYTRWLRATVRTDILPKLVDHPTEAVRELAVRLLKPMVELDEALVSYPAWQDKDVRPVLDRNSQEVKYRSVRFWYAAYVLRANGMKTPAIELGLKGALPSVGGGYFDNAADMTTGGMSYISVFLDETSTLLSPANCVVEQKTLLPDIVEMARRNAAIKTAGAVVNATIHGTKPNPGLDFSGLTGMTL